jgi:hypothetical protein
MIALKSFENKTFGKITKGQTIPERVLKSMDQRALKAAGFIADEEKKEPVKKTIKKGTKK